MEEYGLEVIEKKLKTILTNELNRAGLLFRIHSRIKEKNSISEKLLRKKYGSNSKLMQDIIGFRIVTYFVDDVKIAIDICLRLFNKVELVYDEPDIESFKPLRKNMVCTFPNDLNRIFEELRNKDQFYQIIDNTFEIQFRTTLSEGWHEVDHNLRYKCKTDWVDLQNESRMLNGIYASLETSDQTLKALFEDISYHHYKAKRWEALLRNKFRLKFQLQNLNQELIDILNNDNGIGRKIFKLNRNKVIDFYINSSLTFPITYNTILYFTNYYFIKDKKVLEITPDVLIEEFRNYQLPE